MHLEKELPDEVAFLQKRKKRLLKEIERIDTLTANLLETRQLLARTMNCVGAFTREEWEGSQTHEYQKRFLEGRLVFTPEEIKAIHEKA